MPIDSKFIIHAKHATHRYLATHEDAMIFLARDAALPATLRAYREECERLGSDEAQLRSIDALIGRVDEFQGIHGSRVAYIVNPDPTAEVSVEAAPLEESTQEEQTPQEEGEGGSEEGDDEITE
jgi:hypothetical protein